MLLRHKHMPDLSGSHSYRTVPIYFMVLFFPKYNPVEHICKVMYNSILTPYSLTAQKGGS